MNTMSQSLDIIPHTGIVIDFIRDVKSEVN